LYAVYNYGGIYLDTDIEVIKSFNDLLNLPYFIGSEGNGIIEAGVFGAEKKTDWLANCLSHYDNNRAFIKEDGSYDTLTLPRIMMQQIQKNYSIKQITKPEIKTIKYSNQSKELYMFPQDFFCAKNQ